MPLDKPEVSTQQHAGQKLRSDAAPSASAHTRASGDGLAPSRNVTVAQTLQAGVPTAFGVVYPNACRHCITSVLLPAGNAFLPQGELLIHQIKMRS